MTTIEKGVPIPESRRQKYPFADMQPGDSFVSNSFNVHNSIRFWKRQHPEQEFITRKIGEKQLRVWRTK